MADEIMGESGKKMPTWVWLVFGGGVLLLVMLKSNGSKSTTATDNLLAAELDAELKAMKEAMDLQYKQYKDDQKIAWEEFRLSMEDLIRERQGKADNPAQETTSLPSTGTKPMWWYVPPTWSRRNKGAIAPPTLDEPSGQGTPSFIPDVISGSMFDNYVNGFDFKKAKV